jgi:pimeloyl-ACP methyl ester carboxylesterase
LQQEKRPILIRSHFRCGGLGEVATVVHAPPDISAFIFSASTGAHCCDAPVPLIAAFRRFISGIATATNLREWLRSPAELSINNIVPTMNFTMPTTDLTISAARSAAGTLEVIRRSPKTRAKESVLFVHGGFHAAWCWDEHFLPYFAEQGFDAVALSLRGHGQSEGGEKLDTFGLSDYVDDVAQVASSLPSPPVLIGHSIGAIVAQQFVQSHEARAIVMIAPTPLARMALAKLRWALRFPVATAAMLIRRDINCAMPMFRHLFFSPDMSAGEVDEYMSRMQRESNRVFREISQIRNPNPKAVRIPTLILVAEQDRIPHRINQSLAGAFHAELKTIAAAHDVMLDPRWKLAADRIIKWVLERDPNSIGSIAAGHA